jgi:hypothetical protein
VSDLGADDLELDVGDFARLTLPTTGAEYTAAGGATVAALEGVSFDVAAGQLGENDCLIRVFDHPLGEDTPRFVPDGVTLDALYFLAPYFWGVPDEGFDPLEISIAAPAGWEDGESGSFYLLGDFASSNFITCPGSEENLQLGDFAECGTVTAADGALVLPGISVLGWVGLAKTAE